MSKKLWLFVSVLTLCLCVGCAVNPITGEEEFMLISEDQDIEIGKQYSPEVEKQLGGRIADDTLQSYIDSVGQKIARICHRSQWKYHFIAIDHKMINAMAMPGGYVFITRGMLQKMTTEAQLAALLSHEMVHIVARHSSAAMSRQTGISMVIAGVGASGAMPESGEALRAVQLASQLIGLKYSRDQERQADLAGMDYAVRAGYNPNGAVELMQMLEAQDEFRPADFLSSHPSPENRILYLTTRAQTRYPNVKNLRVAKDDYQKNVLDRLEYYEKNRP